MRLLVCGGRTFNHPALLFRTLDKLHAARRFDAMMQGGQCGADRLAKEWARTKPEIKRYQCKAEWHKYGLGAGPIRNTRMLEWKPDVVVAFKGNNGTADMVRQAREAGVEVIEVEKGGPLRAGA